MLGLALSELFLRVVSVMLGGYGIFCLIMSFAVPDLGAQAFLLLGTATAIVYFCPSGRTPRYGDALFSKFGKSVTIAGPCLAAAIAKSFRAIGRTISSFLGRHSSRGRR
jgi:multisubunit Na+/H+ antiporter MnhB subunit